MLSFRIPRKLQGKKQRRIIKKKKQTRNLKKKSIRAGPSASASPLPKGAIVLKIDSFIKTFQSQSDKICVGGLQWQLTVRRWKEYMHCFLQGSHLDGDSAWSACIEGCIRVVNKKPTLKDRTFSFNGVSIGQPLLEDMAGTLIFFDKTASAALLNPEGGFIEHDSVEVRVDFTVKSVCGAPFDVCTVDGAYPSDAKLLVENTVFHVNKGYLSVISPVFCAMFSDKYTEGNKEGIPLHDIKAEDFKQFLMAVYPMRQPITDANVISIYRLADFYDVKERFLDCEKYLLGQNGVPIFDKLLIADELHRKHLRVDKLIESMSREDFIAVTEAENKRKLDPETVHEILGWHVYLHDICMMYD
ncbi:BTB/POZ domain-containing protein [Aphelenchoides avenae]|nr:BTB/POZ domain-containing protein [Aphelenchus avenae]